MSLILQKVKIENYRCFKTFECEFRKFNTFVGKNASGKSSLLYAIKEINNQSLSPKTTINNIKKNEIQQIDYYFKGDNKNLKAAILNPNLNLTENGYHIEFSNLSLNKAKISVSCSPMNPNLIKNDGIADLFLEQNKITRNNWDFIFSSKDFASIEELTKITNQIFNFWEISAIEISFNGSIIATQTQDKNQWTLHENLQPILYDLIKPKIILFNDEISENPVQTDYDFSNWNANHELSKKILSLGNLSIEEFERFSDSARENFIEEIQEKFNFILKEQPAPISKMQFAFQYINPKLSFKPRLNNKKKIEFSSLSAGLRWLYAFIIIFFDHFMQTKINENGINTIILIDEPGRNIHPEAQLEILKYLKSMKSQNQIVYSTHMPYLIDYMNPESVQCIMFDDISQKHQIEAGEYSTLKVQIADAIGLPKERFLSFPEHILLVEGPSDFLFLNHMNSLYLKKHSDLALSSEIEISSYLGLPEIKHICKLFSQWKRRNFLILYDNDTDIFTSKKRIDPKNDADVQKFPKNVVKLAHPNLKENIAIEDFIPRKVFISTLKAILNEYAFEKELIQQYIGKLDKKTQSQVISLLEKEEQFNKKEFMMKILSETEETELLADKNINFLFQFIKEKWQLIIDKTC